MLDIRQFLLLSVFVCRVEGLQSLEQSLLYKGPLAHEVTQNPQLELAQIVFYFNGKPTIERGSQVQDASNGYKHERYFISHVDAVDICKKKLQEIAQESPAHYRIVCKEIVGQQPGVQVDIYYHPDHVICCFDECDTITNHTGVVVRFMNKELLNKLTLHEAPVVTLAYQKVIAIDSFINA